MCVLGGGGRHTNTSFQRVLLLFLSRIESFTIGPRPLNLTGQHGHFLNSTGDIEPSDMRKNIRDRT